MAFDWQSGRLYYTNVGHSGPSLDGTIYSWHRVEFVEVATKKRKTLFHELENPIAVALDIDQRLVYAEGIVLELDYQWQWQPYIGHQMDG